MRENRSYSILAASEAVFGGLLALGIGLVFILKPADLRDVGLSELVAIVGILDVLYYLSLHQFLKRRFLGWSTLVLTGLSTFSLLAVLAATGGIDSPYFSFWLLVVIALSLFGTVSVIATLTITLGYFLIAFAQHQFDSSYIGVHLPLLAISLVAGALAEWLYLRSRLISQQGSAVASRLTEEQLKGQALMGSMADGVVVIDNQGKIAFINRAAQTMTGWDESAQTLDWRTVLALKTSDGQPLAATDNPVTQAWQAKAPIIRNDLDLVTRAGRNYELSLSVSPINDQQGNINGAIAVFRDVSKEREVERQRNEFISTASHEMRTPVAAIEGYIALAMNTKVAMIDDRARTYLNKAHDNTQHLGDLFRNLLSITKIEEGQVKRRAKPFDLTRLIRDLVQDMQFNASNKHLSLTFTGGVQATGKTILPPTPVMADPERIREVAANLIDNAIKFTEAGGIVVQVTSDKQIVTVSVTDSGPGIAPEDIPHLFQKFYRVDTSATRTVGGTGLGLYLCRQIIELYGGRTWVDSAIGRGSSFHFSLPLIPADKLSGLELVNTSPERVANTPPTQTPIPASAPIPTPAPAPVAAGQTRTSGLR